MRKTNNKKVKRSLKRKLWLTGLGFYVKGFESITRRKFFLSKISKIIFEQLIVVGLHTENKRKTSIAVKDVVEDKNANIEELILKIKELENIVLDLELEPEPESEFEAESTQKPVEKSVAVIKVEKVKEKKDKFEDITFVIAGSFTKTQSYYKDLVIKNGGKLSPSVSSKTDYLLAGDKVGVRLEKASKAGVPIISENEFMDFIKDANFASRII
jgi:NAD-dependent DNA ligase